MDDTGIHRTHTLSLQLRIIILFQERKAADDVRFHCFAFANLEEADDLHYLKYQDCKSCNNGNDDSPAEKGSC